MEGVQEERGAQIIIRSAIEGSQIIMRLAAGGERCPDYNGGWCKSSAYYNGGRLQEERGNRIIIRGAAKL